MQQTVTPATPAAEKSAEADSKPASSTPKAPSPADGSGKKSALTRPHAFVIMPFGIKKGFDGREIDFNTIYSLLIKPTLESAGFEPFRADEETKSGDILTDMFQELLLADLCIADMSIDNANVFYELGIRHAFRKRGIVHIQAGRAYMPFDVFNVRTIPYHITSDGLPDPVFIDKDRAAIERAIRDTYESHTEAVHSPIFNLLDGLTEPDRKTLRTPLARGFWSEHDEWKKRLEVAQRQKRIGDILLLTEEIENPLIKEEAVGEAGNALKNMGYPDLALKEFRKGLAINEKNVVFRREEGLHLNKLGKVDDAIVKIENLLKDVPKDSETIAYLGKIYKETWLGSWNGIRDLGSRRKAAFDAYHWLLKSIETYMKGYRVDFNQYYPGINALTLSTILVDLADRFEDKRSPDPEIAWIRNNLADLRGSMIFALESLANSGASDYWSLVSLAELRVLTSPSRAEVVREYRKAMIASRRSIYYLESSLGQLEILKSLNMFVNNVEAAIRVVRDELRHIKKEDYQERSDESKRRKGHVFLFTGYMLSTPDQENGHFPAAKEAEIREAIRAALRKYDADEHDFAVTAGMAAGSEILFVEACVERRVPVQVFFPTYEAEYVQNFVRPCGEEWVARFYNLRNHRLVDESYQPDRVGSPKQGDNLFERNNRWTLYSAWRKGIDKLRLIAVWDGKTETATGLNAKLVMHMVDLMRGMGGQIEHINTSKLNGSTVKYRDARGGKQKPKLPGKK